jgi:hypothetical protein
LTNKSNQEYRGINLKGVTGIFDIQKQMFPYDYCKFKSKVLKMESVVEHFITKHLGCYWIKCWLCIEEVKTMDDFKKHIGQTTTQNSTYGMKINLYLALR